MPVVRTIQKVWPETKLSWIIGKLEYQLVHDIPGIEFIQFDKKAGLRGYLDIRNKLKDLQFDVLLDMQMSLRASMISLFVNSPIKLGFDKQRAKDMQWLFTNHKIKYKPEQHVIDSFFGFTQALGISERSYDWQIPIPELDIQQIAAEFDPGKSYAVISPCSSMAYRNWSIEGYAAVADYLQQQYGLQVILSGGPGAIELDYAKQITSLCKQPLINLVGKTSLKELLALLQSAKLVIAPDSGPAHLANAVGVPVIGLYACTNPDRARPYNNADYVANKYPEAIKDNFGKTVNEVPWGTRVREDGTMNRISVNDVQSKIKQIMA